MVDFIYTFAMYIMDAVQVLPQPMRFPIGALLILVPLCAPFGLVGVFGALIFARRT